MRRRVRKKLRLGEFREFGLELTFALPTDSSEAQLDAFWHELVEEVESRGLLVGGGSGQRWDAFVTRARGSATEGDRDALRGWLEQHGLVTEVRIGELVDAWDDA